METIPYVLLITTILGLQAGRMLNQRLTSLCTIALCAAAIGLTILRGV